MSIGKKFIKYVSLNVLGMLALSCYILADTFFVSWSIGNNGIAALNFAISIFSIINACGLMLGIGGGTAFSMRKTDDRENYSNKIFTNTVIFGLTLGFIFLIVGVVFSEKLSILLGADAETLNYTTVYLKTLMCFAPLFILNNILIGFVRNDGAPKMAMQGMVIGSLSNIVLDYIFIIPLNMGMFGAAFATGLAPLISILCMLPHFIKKKNSFKLVKCKFSIKLIGKICHLGANSFIVEVALGIVLIIFNLKILSITGTLGVAAYAIVANIALVLNALFTGIAQGIQPLLSSEFALENKKSIKKILKMSVLSSFALFVVMYAAINIFSKPLISIFNKENSEVVFQIATLGFRLYFIGFLFSGLNIILSQYFSATVSPNKGFIVALLHGGLCIIPLVYILSNLLGMSGVWLSFVLAEEITTVVAIIFLKNSTINRTHSIQ